MSAEEKEAQEKTDAAPAKGGSKKLIIIILAVLLLLAIAGAGAFFALSGSKHEAGEDGEEEEEEGEEGLEELPGAVFPLEVFIVNLGVKGSFLKASIQLEFVEPELPPTLDNDVPKLRDAIIKVMSSKTATEILTAEGKEQLRNDIKDVVNETIGGEEVLQIYFTEFIIQ
ncbi:MAG: flagellar basal body-associated FliL family protein [Deltaproteobacteria bacterium]|nr:flagellar basal body-associated FliL family protein [Deltaproteobacteria bacterium]